VRIRADAEPFHRQRRLRYENLLAAFVAELLAHRYSRSLVIQAERVLPRLFAALLKRRVRDVRAVGEEHLTAFLREQAQSKTARGALPAPASLLSYTNIVRRFFAFLDKRGLILRNPAQDLPARHVEQLPPKALSKAEAEALMNAPHRGSLIGQRDAAIIEVFYGTAIRLSECVRLDLTDLDLRDGLLLVRNGKGKKDRIVPLAGRAAAAIEAYLAETRPAFIHDPKESAVFLTRHGGRLSAVSVDLIVRRYGEGLGLKVSPHGLRHACATHLLRGGADVRHLQELLGHRFLDTTARYAQVAIKDLRDVIEKAHPREKRRRIGASWPRL
jgi:site-specific recombinase XerD